MPAPLLIYGATGYSGRKLVAEAQAHGLAPILAGRNAAKLAPLGDTVRLPWRAATLEDHALDAALADVAVVLNAAGPFSHTADALAAACIRTGTHYLDIAGEVRVAARMAERHAMAHRRGVMLMPAVGFDVVPSDCLAAHVTRRLPGARRLATAVTQPRFLSLGSIRTLIDSVDVGLARRAGALASVAVGSIERAFDFGWGPVPCLNVSFADVVTAYYTTGVPSVTTFVEASPLARAVLSLPRALAPVLRMPGAHDLLRGWAALLPGDAVTTGTRDDVTMRVVVEAEDAAGHRARARLRTPEVYALTATAAIAVAARVLTGDVEPGFQTPARVYGPDFVLTLGGVEREDLE